MTTTGTEPTTTAGTTPGAPTAPSGKQRTPSARDIAGRKREYETIYILRPDSTNDVIGQVNTKARSVIETGGGTIIKIDNWGKRKLAYEVQKQLKGIYLFFSYLGSAGLVEELERNLRLTDSVIRYYSVKIAENVDPKVRTSEFTEEAFTSAATPGPDEEEIATGQASVASPFDEEEGAFDFEEAVFGSVDEPGRGRRGEGK
jgi:small subunit ribosomal protein S6